MRKATNIICIVLILGYIIFLAVGWNNFPAEVPKHFNAAGVADSFGPRTTLLIDPSAMIGLFLLLALAESFPKIWNIPVEVTEDNAEDIVRTVRNMFGVIKISAVLVCAFAGLMCIYQGFPAWPMYLFVGIILLSIITGIIQLFRYR